jgi:hypothetical protein
MAAIRLRTETPTEYFKELVESALDHQQVSADSLTAYYVVNLLCGFVQPASAPGAALDDLPLGMRLAHAMQLGGCEHRVQLRRVGDLSLFTSGFFSDSLARSLVNVDYYRTLGEFAYASLSRVEPEAFASVFAELSDKFDAFSDVLAEVSERSALSTNADLLRMYEKWLRTGSRRDGQRLVERGIVPNASIGSRSVQ